MDEITIKMTKDGAQELLALAVRKAEACKFLLTRGTNTVGAPFTKEDVERISGRQRFWENLASALKKELEK